MSKSWRAIGSRQGTHPRLFIVLRLFTDFNNLSCAFMPDWEFAPNTDTEIAVSLVGKSPRHFCARAFGALLLGSRVRTIHYMGCFTL